MSGFDADWLALRAAADGVARRDATDALLGGGPALEPDLRVVDLGAGTGNNVLHLAPHLARRGARRQRWILVDDDVALLAGAAERARARHPSIDLEVSEHACDLALDLGRVPFEGAGVVTAAALLDLASRAWIQDLARALDDARVPLVLAALNVDGRVEWTPEHPFDARAHALFHADMRRDKGLGPALAGDAPDVFADAFDALGYDIVRADSAWRLVHADAALQARYLDDVAAAVARTGPAAEIEDWRRHRRAWIERGASTLVVGHVDLLARR